MNDISPEEKLFNIIEGKNSEFSKKPEERSGQFAGILKSLEIWQRTLKEQLHKIHLPKKRPFAGFNFSEFNLEITNRILIVILGGLIIFLFVDFIYLKPDFKKIYEKISALPAARLKKRDVIYLKPLSAYLDASAKRDIFNPIAITKEDMYVERIVRLEELTKGLSLVGIFWGKNPEVMIEDTEEKKTYFLRRGQTIKGIKIDSILEDRVILEHNNETMEFM